MKDKHFKKLKNILRPRTLHEHTLQSVKEVQQYFVRGMVGVRTTMKTILERVPEEGRELE